LIFINLSGKDAKKRKVRKEINKPSPSLSKVIDSPLSLRSLRKTFAPLRELIFLIFINLSGKDAKKREVRKEIK